MKEEPDPGCHLETITTGEVYLSLSSAAFQPSTLNKLAPYLTATKAMIKAFVPAVIWQFWVTESVQVEGSVALTEMTDYSTWKKNKAFDFNS